MGNGTSSPRGWLRRSPGEQRTVQAQPKRAAGATVCLIELVYGRPLPAPQHQRLRGIHIPF